jgi:cell division protein ZapE
MRAIHDQLSLLRGQQNPLKLIARNFAKQYRILCLDEFHVADITDAMLLYGLLEALFQEGVCLVATSNQPPDELYKNGLQRDRFLPAIKLIKQHTTPVFIDGDIDHRLRLLEKADTWYDAGHPESQRQLRARFEELAPCEGSENLRLRINYRTLETILCADDVAWFGFHTLCAGPRASADYIEIARRFHTLFISEVPVMNEASDDLALRFVNMIDEFYDRNLKLIISAAAGPEALYQGQQLSFEFQRTASRLEEMRSHAYLQRPHKP